MSKIFTLVRIPARLIKRSESRSSGNGKDWRFKMRKLAFNLSVFNKYGLYTDDVRDHENPVVAEALRRLPKDVLDARNFRLTRGMQLDMMKIYLPKEKWTTYEQDLEYRYLTPYVREVMEERMEIYNFGCSNYGKEDWPDGMVK
ncbi:Cytochrome b-c1 complex subunit 7 [Habropoda laboriosa]|uniref:Cytochrome b-c1 complex subunit 7 n=1 Tax=Habropoda laboriosa TaxID=597456 RepID=A0A0L7RE51_9HYME|nr:Cytochrome b-c1 complex subunit 7 [Habropoda laboriosa]